MRGLRGMAVVGLVGLLLVVGASEALAHAGLRSSDPAAGSTLGASPTAVRLTFSEQPDPLLSVIHVLGAGATTYESGPPEAVPGDPLAIAVPVRPTGRGVYSVTWRVVSAEDGHATAGSFVFGVRQSPVGVAAAPAVAEPVSSPLEMVARWLWLAGLIVVIGVAASAVARFADPDRVVGLGAVGWAASVAGLALLAEAQRRNAAVPFGTLWGTSVGRGLAWRAGAVAGAGVALLVAWTAPRRFRRGALVAAGAAALVALWAHVEAGHAGAGGTLDVAVQWVHAAAVGVWLGGLAALLVGLRGTPAGSEVRAAAVRRFSAVAGVGLVAVAATGLVRAVQQLSSFGELFSTAYGLGVLAKALLIVVIGAFGWRNRRRSVPAAAADDLRPLRRTSRRELAAAATAVAVAAALGTLAPPAARSETAPPVLTAEGTDAAGTVRVTLTTASVDPGPNRFVLRAASHDEGAPVGGSVTLRFVPLDDPDVPASELALAPRPDGSYFGTGSNLAFDGRWGVTALLEKGDDSVAVPLELEVRTPAQFVSVERRPGLPPNFTVEVSVAEAIRFSPRPERAGPSTVVVTVFDEIGDEVPVTSIVVTSRAGDGPARRVPVQRAGIGRFTARVDLAEGTNQLAAVAQSRDRGRLRAVLDLTIPAG